MSHILRELLEAIILAVVVFFVIQISVQNFRVEGRSMQPTLEDDDYLMVTKAAYFKIDMQRLARLVPFWDVAEPEEKYLPFSHPPERGDVVVFHAPSTPPKDFVKRVVGLPGETVEIKDGRVHINDVPLSESYLPISRPLDSMDAVELDTDEYFVLGDNRPSSNDSRDWGPVPLTDIIGKVWFVYWPWSKLPLPSLGTLGL